MSYEYFKGVIEGKLDALQAISTCEINKKIISGIQTDFSNLVAEIEVSSPTLFDCEKIS